MDKNITKLLSGLNFQDDIYWYNFTNKDQEEEIKLREAVADYKYDDYLLELSKHHSIPVMDKEVLNFLELIPRNGIIIDVGGCWGWHWRDIHMNRPDVKVFIIDFVRNNLVHARNILKGHINNNIFLIHGDATNLIFDDSVFDGYWSVQVLQHIPNYELCVKEAHRVLKNGAAFANYSFNTQWFVRMVYLLLGKKYHINGYIPEVYFMARASNIQFEMIKAIFGTNEVKRRYTEILFSPELKVNFPGKLFSLSGLVDAYLSNNSGWFSGFARQQSYHVIKHGCQ